MEIFRDIKGYEGLYQVSNKGTIVSLNYNRKNMVKRLKPFISKFGYTEVKLYDNGKRKGFRVHRLVAEAFIPNPNNLPQVNHKDEDKTNNCVENLEWCDCEYNIKYGTHIQRQREKMSGKNHPMYGKFGKEHHHSKPINQYTKDGKFIKRWDCIKDAQYELKCSHISKCARGIYKTSGGYIWKYA